MSTLGVLSLESSVLVGSDFDEESLDGEMFDEVEAAIADLERVEKSEYVCSRTSNSTKEKCLCPALVPESTMPCDNMTLASALMIESCEETSCSKMGTSTCTVESVGTEGTTEPEATANEETWVACLTKSEDWAWHTMEKNLSAVESCKVSDSEAEQCI